MRAAVIGASGYTGAELLRILWNHPEFEVTVATAHSYRGQRISSLYPSLAGFYPEEFGELELEELDGSCDVVFLALPHGSSMEVLPDIIESDKKVVDLSADFRLPDVEQYGRWYDIQHSCPELLTEAVYGLTEVNREKIAVSDLVANPGCYPTGVLLGVLPFVYSGLLTGKMIIDAKSGVSGAGRKLSLKTHYPQVADGMAPYAVSGHRHLPEIEMHVGTAVGGDTVEVVFVPHLAPMNRGILSTMYLQLGEDLDTGEARDIFCETFGGEEFVLLLDEGQYPQTKNVQGTNNCHVSLEMIGGHRLLVVMTAIDNLVKGASGQAVQNMNVMCGFPQGAGLSGPGVFP